MTCPQAYSDGAYVLGALGPAERSAYEAHLAQCPACAGAVAQLAVLPGLLGRVSEDVLQPVQPAPNALDRLIEKVTALRRRQARLRWFRFSAALASVVMLAVAGTMAVIGLPEPDLRPALAAMEPTSPETLVTAEVGYDAVSSGGGTKVWMVCRYPVVDYEIPTRTFRLVATGIDGSTDQLGSWRAGPGDELDLAGLTEFSPTQLASLEVQGADGTPLLVYEMP